MPSDLIQNADPGLVDTIVSQARAYATQRVGDIVSAIGSFSNPVEGLRHLQTAEEQAYNARALLVELNAAGLATADDFKAFDRMRGDLWVSEMSVWHTLVYIFSYIGMAENIPQLPVPQIVPAVSRQPQPAGVSGLGNPAAAAAPAAALPAAAFWAAAVIAVLTALAVVAVVVGFTLAAYQISNIFIAQAQAEQLQSFYNTRLGAYRQCLAAGRTPQECSASIATLVPTPNQALPPTLQPNPVDWVFSVGAGVGLAALVGVGVYAWRSRSVKDHT